MAAGHPIQARLSEDELNALDSYRRRKLNPPSRAQALRELANRGLAGIRSAPPLDRANEHEPGTVNAEVPNAAV